MKANKGKGSLRSHLDYNAWTLPSSQAVSLGSQLDYVLVQCEIHGAPARLILAEALLENAMKRFEVAEYHILGRAQGHQLENKQLNHPIL